MLILKSSLFAILLFVLMACDSHTERDRFREKLNQLVNELAIELDELRPGRKEVTGPLTLQSKKIITYQISYAFSSATAARKIVRHFDNVQEALLKEDIEGFDEWGEMLKKDLVRHHTKLQTVAKKTAEKIKDNLSSFREKNSKEKYGHPIRISDEGKLFFVLTVKDITTGYMPETMLEFDFDQWLTKVKEMSRKEQDVAKD